MELKHLPPRQSQHCFTLVEYLLVHSFIHPGFRRPEPFSQLSCFCTVQLYIYDKNIKPVSSLGHGKLILCFVDAVSQYFGKLKNKLLCKQ